MQAMQLQLQHLQQEIRRFLAIASVVSQIDTDVCTFSDLINTIGTPEDTPDLRDRMHKMVLHIEQLVEEIKEAREAADLHFEVSARKDIDDDKLTRNILTVKEFQQAKKLAALRETAYSPFVPSSGISGLYLFGTAVVLLGVLTQFVSESKAGLLLLLGYFLLTVANVCRVVASLQLPSLEPGLVELTATYVQTLGTCGILVGSLSIATLGTFPLVWFGILASLSMLIAEVVKVIYSHC